MMVMVVTMMMLVMMMMIFTSNRRNAGAHCLLLAGPLLNPPLPCDIVPSRLAMLASVRAAILADLQLPATVRTQI